MKKAPPPEGEEYPPARTWAEVASEYNRRHPDSPIKGEKHARALAHKAHAKLKMALAQQITPRAAREHFRDAV